MNFKKMPKVIFLILALMVQAGCLARANHPKKSLQETLAKIEERAKNAKQVSTEQEKKEATINIIPANIQKENQVLPEIISPEPAVSYPHGVDEKQAVGIAKKLLLAGSYSSEYNAENPVLVTDQESLCATNYWIVKFPHRNLAREYYIYYAIIEKKTGHVLRAENLLAKGDYWIMLLREIPGCAR